MRKPVVIDTNVLLVANGGPEYSPYCAANCAKRLVDIRDTGQVVLDTGREILKEYTSNQPATAQPGVGYQFWKWILNNSHSTEHCKWVTINRHDSRGYDEFPDHAGLKTFDPSDRKFVAVAVSHGGYPPILQGTDSKWVGWKDSLAECGVAVEFLCRDEIEKVYKRKFDRKPK